MKTIPDIVDENGDLQLHGRQGLIAIIQFADEDGVAEDVSAKSMTFECGTDINVALTAGDFDDEKILALTNDQIKIIAAARNKDFAVMDSSEAEPIPRWVGTVYMYGWVE